MRRRERRTLAFKWAKMDLKEMGVPHRQLIAFVKMYQEKLRLDPHYKRRVVVTQGEDDG